MVWYHMYSVEYERGEIRWQLRLGYLHSRIQFLGNVVECRLLSAQHLNIQLYLDAVVIFGN